MTQGLISVVMPSYNCAKYLPETIASIQSQTYRNWELLLVDDCSTDNTESVVKEFAASDLRVRYHRLEAQFGAAVARTEAMRLANGEYIAFCDSDDLWLPEKLEKQLDFMHRTGHSYTCTAYEQVDEAGKPLGRVLRPQERCDYNRVLLDCPIGNSTVMYSVKDMGKFEVPNIRKRNDDALWLAMLKKEPYIWGMPDVLTRYRVRPSGISGNKFKLVKYHWILYREIEHLSIMRSLFHIAYWGIIKGLHLK